eukprot:scaffold3670_cov124-Cylindrotheca_fusiformis.AAC.2
MEYQQTGSDEESTTSPPFFPTELLQHAPLGEDEASATLSAAMSSMSMKEREKVLYDIHGVNEIQTETFETQQEKLRQLETELLKLEKGTRAYKLALLQNPGQVRDPEFRLQFLRSAEWDAKEAALKLVQFYQAKLELFGEHLLGKTITHADLSPEVLPFRDTAGRSILIHFPSLLQDSGATTDDMIRASWYTGYSSLRDVETTTNGTVLIHYLKGVDESKMDIAALQSLGKFALCLPCRVRAMHICNADTQGTLYNVLAFKLVDTSSRVRIKNISGSHREIVYHLQTFGIQERVLPLTKHGEILLDVHQKWLNRQRRWEEATDKAFRILTPTNKDVLSGRGRGVQEHVGNLRFRHLIDELRQEYDAHKDLFGAKGMVANKVINEIISQGGRFLKDDGIGWVRLKDSDAREKVSMTFRSRRKEFNSFR